MESTRRERMCRKRRCINSTRSAEAQRETEKTVVLPTEMWHRILLSLWLNEEDHESILSCRLVSHSFKDLVDSMPPKLYWNPWMKFNAHYPAGEILENSPATSLTCDEDVSNFLAKLPPPNSAADVQNPFRKNETVRLFKDIVSFHEMKEDLKTILLQYGSFIKKLILVLTGYAPKRLSSLSQILQSMENLQTLIIDVCYISTDKWAKSSSNRCPTNLKSLRELVIAKLTGESMFSNLADSYGPQIKHLTLSYESIRIDHSNFLSKFPNLEDLKLDQMFVNRIYLEKPLLGSSWPKLKRLALGVRNCVEDSIGFKNVVTLITMFSSTLELLSLDIGRPEDPDCNSTYDIFNNLRRNEEDEDILFVTPFPQLKKLVLPFCFVRRDRATLEDRFNFHLPSLKVVILQDFEDEFKDEDISQAEFRMICKPLWKLVPQAVETICVRTGKWKDHLGMCTPVIYKCSRTTAT